jgi:hypothetical protein
MTYLRITQDFIDLTNFSLIKELLVELDENGTPRREIGYNSDGELVHIFPSDKFKYGKHGVLDLVHFDLNSVDGDDLSSELFNDRWLKQ